MKRFKIGQVVYYYLDNGDYTGAIIECTITKATKDLETGKITYQVTTANEDKCSWYFSYLTNRDLTDEYLYASKKQIEKEYKDAIAYNKLYKAIESLERIFNELKLALEPKKEYVIPEGMTISINDANQKFSNLYIDAKDVILEGKISLMKEIDKLKKKVKDIEKKIKPATKKKVESEKKKLSEAEEQKVVGSSYAKH